MTNNGGNSWGDDDWSKFIKYPQRSVLVEVEVTDSEEDENDDDMENEREEVQAVQESASSSSVSFDPLDFSLGAAVQEDSKFRHYVDTSNFPSRHEDDRQPVSGPFDPLDKPGLRAAVQRAYTNAYDVNDTANFVQNPFLPSGRVGTLGPADRTIVIDPRRFKRCPFDPNRVYREEKRKEEEKWIRAEKARRSCRGRAPIRMTTGPPRRLPEETVEQKLSDESSQEEVSRDENHKRRFENTEFPIFRLGDPSDVEPEMRHARLKPECKKIKRFQSTKKARDVESLVTDSDDSSSNSVPTPDMVSSPERNDNASLTFFQCALSSSQKKKIKSAEAVPRRCRFPPANNPYIDYWKLPKNQAGSVPLECLCCVPSVKVPDEADSRMVPIMKCQATFRDEKSRLIRCPAIFPPDSKFVEYFWLPQNDQIGVFCPDHALLLRAHKICPFCNEFVSQGSQGSYAICRGSEGNVTHLYHPDCRKFLNLRRSCPHCLKSQVLCLEPAFDGITRSKFFPDDEGIDFSGMTDGLDFETIDLPEKWNLQKRTVGGYFSDSDAQEMVDFLHYAKNRNLDDRDLSIMSFLKDILSLEENQNISDLDKDGNSLLHVAAKSGKVSAVLVLCAIGVDLNLTNATDEKDTSLMLAVKAGHPAIIYALVRAGANINVQDPLGRTPLHWAAYHRRYEVMEFLLQNEALSEVEDVDGFTFIFSTLSWITEEHFYGLAQNRVNLKVIDRDGWTLLHWIALLGRNDLVGFFLDLEVINVKDSWGETPVHVATRVENKDFITALMNNRDAPKSDRYNYAGMTAWDIAVENSNNVSVANGELNMQELLFRYLGDPARDEGVVGGEVLGDISRGKSLIPIPCYNFVNFQCFPKDLLYSDIVVKPFIFQLPPRLQPDKGKDKLEPDRKHRLRPPCRFPLNHSVESCEDPDSQCHCMVEERPLCCCRCNETGNNDIQHRCSRIQNGRLTNRDGTPASLPKPPLTEAYARNLLYRLSRKIVHSQAAVAEDLRYISDLVKIAYCPEHRSRSRSVPIRRQTASHCKRSQSCPLRAPEDMKKLKDCKKVLRDSKRRREEGRFMSKVSIINDGPPVLPKPTTEEKTKYEFWCENPMDLFVELQEFVVDDLIAAAMIWFERRHHFERWDLSSYHELALRKHPKMSIRKVKFSLPASDPENDWQVDFLEECSVLCDCSRECSNRLTQTPSLARVALKYYDNIIGWGVIALARIMGGEMIAEYTGEVYNEAECCLYDDDTYIYELKNLDYFQRYDKTQPKKEGSMMIVDALRVGNVARFLNHSCRPNAVAVEVIPHGLSYSKIVLYATRTIYPTEQLTLDYGDTWWLSKHKNCNYYCRCGEQKCKYTKKLLRQMVEKEKAEATEQKRVMAKKSHSKTGK